MHEEIQECLSYLNLREDCTQRLATSRTNFQEHALSVQNLKFSKKLQQLQREQAAAESTLMEERETLSEYKDKMKELELQQQSLLNDTTNVLPDRRLGLNRMLRGNIREVFRSNVREAREGLRRADLKLYQYIANIKFDRQTPENIIAGFTKSVSGQLEPFSFNLKESSHFYITNQLWALMGDEAVKGGTTKRARAPLKEMNSLPVDG